MFKVWGLGFGDDEAEWCFCGEFPTRKEAEDKVKEILTDTGLPPEYVQITDPV